MGNMVIRLGARAAVVAVLGVGGSGPGVWAAGVSGAGVWATGGWGAGVAPAVGAASGSGAGGWGADVAPAAGAASGSGAGGWGAGVAPAVEAPEADPPPEAVRSPEAGRAPEASTRPGQAGESGGVPGSPLRLAPREAGTDLRATAYVRRAADRLGAPGVAWAVVRDGRVAASGATGADGNGAPMTPATRVYLGSVSKPVLATVAVTMHDRGELDLDTPVAWVLPGLGRVAPGADAITVRQLLAHTSGLPFGADELDVADPGRDAGRVVAGLSGVGLVDRPGRAYHYSSLGYVVLQAVLEKVSGRPLAALTRSVLPLPGLAGARESLGTVAPGRRSGLLPLPDLQAPVDGAGSGYGYTAGSAATLAALTTATMGDPARLAEMLPRQVPAAGETVTGLGWRVTTQADGALRVWHTGMVPGYFTAVHMVPAEHLAVVLVTNRSGILDEQRLYDAGAGLLAVARGEASPSLPGRGWTAVLALLAMLGCALAGLLLVRRRRRSVGVVGWVVLALLAAAPWIASTVMGVPLRYPWLWAPDLVVLAPACALAAGLLSRVRPRRRPAPVRGRSHPGRDVHSEATHAMMVPWRRRG